MPELTTIFWDFDGVILNSNEVRDQGFTEVLKDYPPAEVQALMDFHQANGGLSRYVKFRYFFEEVRKETLSEERLLELCASFSQIMRQLLTDTKLLIAPTVAFIRANYQNYQMHIVSGSDQEELRYLCKNLGIDHFFKSIHGSPTPKTELVRNLLQQHNYSLKSCLLIGDSINDYEAAEGNGIYFEGYNSSTAEDLSYGPFCVLKQKEK